MASIIFIFLALLLALISDVVAQSLPVVDLGYVRYSVYLSWHFSIDRLTGTPSSYQSKRQLPWHNHSLCPSVTNFLQPTLGTYNFSNIRYAAPPVGELRFAAPIPPTGNSSRINNGSIGAVCPQAAPAWSAIAQEFVPAYLSGQPFNLSAAEAGLTNITGALPAQDPRTSEDCLFLDIVVPQKIFNANTSTLAPVMVWIYGGGYTTGEKTGSGVYNPGGLITASQATGAPGIVYVAINYRVRLSSPLVVVVMLIRQPAWRVWLACRANSPVQWDSKRCTLRPAIGASMGSR